MSVALTVSGVLVAADTGTRTLTYRLLPFGEPGRTSAGVVTASPGVIDLPDRPGDVVLNVEHDRTRPVGVASSIREEPSGILASFTVLSTTAGNDLLAEADAGVRRGVSVELADVVIRGGALTAGRLVAAGAVVAPAFPSAQLVAADTDPEPEPVEEPLPIDDPEPEPDPDTVEGDETTNGDTVSPTLDAAAPAALVASAASGPPPITLPRVTAMLAARGRGTADADLLAALTDITHTANIAAEAPQWVDEVWSGMPYERQIVPLLTPGQLTALKVVGWKWTVAPAGGDYAGDKGPIPSNAAVTAPVEYTAARFAGGHDVDRAFLDFGDAGFWSSYWANQAKSYALWSDGHAAAGLVAAAPAVVPAGTGVVAAIVAAALAVIPTGPPTFALLGTAAFAELVERDPLAFLSGSVSLSDGSGNVGGITYRASTAVAADQVLVGNRNAATWYELGSTPIRVEAVNVANGGIDVAAFGYGVVGINDAAGLAKATVAVPVP